MGRPTIGGRPMSAFERKRRQIKLEKSGDRATNAGVDRKVVELFLQAVRDRPNTTVMTIAHEVREFFSQEEDERAAARLGLE